MLESRWASAWLASLRREGFADLCERQVGLQGKDAGGPLQTEHHPLAVEQGGIHPAEKFPHASQDSPGGQTVIERAQVDAVEIPQPDVGNSAGTRVFMFPRPDKRAEIRLLPEGENPSGKTPNFFVHLAIDIREPGFISSKPARVPKKRTGLPSGRNGVKRRVTRPRTMRTEAPPLPEACPARIRAFSAAEAVEDFMNLSALRVDLTNRNQIEDIRQILAFLEAFQIAHSVKLEGNQVKRFRDRKRLPV